MVVNVGCEIVGECKDKVSICGRSVWVDKGGGFEGRVAGFGGSAGVYDNAGEIAAGVGGVI